MKINKQRIATLGLGHVGNILTGKVIDWGVDPLITVLLNCGVGGVHGLLLTWVALSVVSFLACYATLKFYDWSKTDWLGIEYVKTLRELEGVSRTKRMIAWLLRKGDSFAVIALSIIFDPFIVLVYMRHGANHYNGLTKRDWKIFLVSILISNGWQTVLLYGGFEGIKRIWNVVF